MVLSVACTLLEQQSLFDPTCEVWDDALRGFARRQGKVLRKHGRCLSSSTARSEIAAI